MKKISFLTLLLVLFSGIQASDLNVKVRNNSVVTRVGEVIEIPWNRVTTVLGQVKESSLIVLDEAGHQVPFQLETKGGKSIVFLLVTVTVQPSSTVRLVVKRGTPDAFQSQVYGRLVPERKDDYAWENNKVAFRMYGPALEKTGEISNGIDLWVKRTEKLVINEWYSKDLSGVASYHEDHGEGMDCYKVGRTLGLGATAPYEGDSLWLGNNFIRCQVLDNGPLRVTCRLTYAPFKVNGTTVNEIRIISLDANSHFNKVTEIYETSKATMKIATGIVLRNEITPKVIYNAQNGYMAYTEPEDVNNSIVYVGVISPKGFEKIKVAKGHLMGLNSYVKGMSYTYYTGGGWSKSGFASTDEWNTCVKNFAASLNEPLEISFK